MNAVLMEVCVCVSENQFRKFLQQTLTSPSNIMKYESKLENSLGNRIENES